MTIAETINWGTQQLLVAGSQPETAGLDAEVLLTHILKQSKEYLYTYHQHLVSDAELDAFKKAVQERSHGMPVAYIVGYKSFYGRDFIVTPDVLIPRPETELMVELVQRWLDTHPIQSPIIADIGTGSGCLAITLCLEIPESKILATDISEKACAIAQKNSVRHNADIDIISSDVLQALGDQPVDIIVANLPYGTRELFTDQSIAHEPDEALYADENGLGLYHALFKQTVQRKFLPQYIVVEFDPRQTRDIVELASRTLPSYLLAVVNDLTDRPRFLEAVLKSPVTE